MPLPLDYMGYMLIADEDVQIRILFLISTSGWHFFPTPWSSWDVGVPLFDWLHHVGGASSMVPSTKKQHTQSLEEVNSIFFN